MELSNNTKILLKYIIERKESSIVRASEDETCPLSNLDKIRVCAEQLSAEGLIELQNITETRVEYTKEGLWTQGKGLAEIRLLKKIEHKPISISELEEDEKRFGISYVKKNGWARIESGKIIITDKGREVLEKKLYIQLVPKEKLHVRTYEPEVVSELVSRNIIQRKVKTIDAKFSATKKGEEYAKTIVDLDIKSDLKIAELTHQMLLSGSWKNKKLKKYDLRVEPAYCLGARRHPISRLRDRIQMIFSSMGFEQMEGPIQESSFWVFDALFQPQDHPARDLADTFYLEEIDKLPDLELVERVRESHERGWKYKWSADEAKKMVLRTHTTAVSAHKLHENRNNKEPKKFFAIGKVFRNEATDYKHLAEFFQVEGIISWDGANFSHLLGTLKTFYSKLGFEKIRFRPSFFPYTEPSLEIEVFHPIRKEWIELGGAGILRPEVSIPLCNKYPVLAWGLSLERPLMLASNTADIRTLYRNDLDWLREFEINR